MEYTITLTKAESKAMEYIAVDVHEWITNSVTDRARIAIDEICNIYMKHKLDNNQPITATNKFDMVFAAYNEGLIKSAYDKKMEDMVPGHPI